MMSSSNSDTEPKETLKETGDHRRKLIICRKKFDKLANSFLVLIDETLK